MYLITITNTICKEVVNYFGPPKKGTDYLSKYLHWYEEHKKMFCWCLIIDKFQFKNHVSN